MFRKIIFVIVWLLMAPLTAAALEAELADARRPSASSVASYTTGAGTGDTEQSADIALYSRLLAATRAYQKTPTTETEKAFQDTCNQLELYLKRARITKALAQWRRLFAQEMSPQKLKEIIQLAEIYLATSSGSDSDDDMPYGTSPGGGPLPAIRPAGLPPLNLSRCLSNDNACVPPSGPLSCIAEDTERTGSATPATTPAPAT